MEKIVIIGPTASSKSKLAIDIAKSKNANILSLDSLSIYKEIDVVSAKVLDEHKDGIEHFGVDLIYPNIEFNVAKYIEYCKDVIKKTNSEGKNLVIVGGTSFYLKMLIDGISKIPMFSADTIIKTKEQLTDITDAYEFCKKIDPNLKIEKNDKFRIEKNLLIYHETKVAPSKYLKENREEPILKNYEIYQTKVSKDNLYENIVKRYNIMIKLGLIEEIEFLDKKYGRNIKPMKAIGIVETLDYIDGKIDMDRHKELIVRNTCKLAKRQNTFNKNQFQDIIVNTMEMIYKGNL